MVFDKQHLSLFVALAFLLAYANAVPAAALSNERNVERLRGDLHQFIEMIMNCLTNSKPNHSKFNSSQIQQFKQISDSLQDDVGLSAATEEEVAGGENPKTRKFGGGSEEPEDIASSETAENISESNEETKDDSRESKNLSREYKDPLKHSKETTESYVPASEGSSGYQNSEEQASNNRREFDIQEGNGHGFTPRPSNIDVTLFGDSAEKMSTTIAGPTTYGNDIGLRILHPSGGGSKEETTDESLAGPSSVLPWFSGEVTSDGTLSKEEDDSDVLNAVLSLKDNVFNLSSEIGKIQQNLSNAMKIFDPTKESAGSQTSSGRKSNTGDSSSNESKDKSQENNTEEIQVRNFIKEPPKFASGSSVHPYDALHIYGIQENGPINKIVFEGGEHHPPRPLTVRESNHLKEFIKMVLNTNKMHSPMATFPMEEEVAPRSGLKGSHGKKSPWADKPVPLELV